MTEGSGVWIKEWRKRNGYTQDMLATEMKVKRQTVIAWEQASNADRILYLALTALDENVSLRKVLQRKMQAD